MPLKRDRAEYWRDAMLGLGLLIIGILIALDLLIRTSEVKTIEDLDTLKLYVDVFSVWTYVTYLVGIPALSVGIMLAAIMRLEAEP